jgi:hypothetical protein
MPAPLLQSPRAKQIAEGLVRTGRASNTRLFRTWLQLGATAGNFYWIALGRLGAAPRRHLRWRGGASAELRRRHGARRGDAMIGRAADPVALDTIGARPRA